MVFNRSKRTCDAFTVEHTKTRREPIVAKKNQTKTKCINVPKLCISLLKLIKTQPSSMCNQKSKISNLPLSFFFIFGYVDFSACFSFYF